MKILHITDLHSCAYGKRQAGLIKKIESIRPDVICMTGDIADDRRNISHTIAMLEGIKKYPCFYVFGNHEVRTKKTEAVAGIFERYGVYILSELRNRLSVNFDINGKRITFCGVDDPEYKGLGKTKKQLSSLNRVILKNRNFTILLSHRPELADRYRNLSFDLVLSGHAHGGQWIIPFLINGVYAPMQGFFPKYAGGLYKLNENAAMVVCRGLALNNPVPRIFNPPELAVIEIEGEN